MSGDRGFLKRRWLFLLVWSLLTLVQFCVLYGIDEFLRPPSLTAVASPAEQDLAADKPEVPANAVRTVYSGDNQYAAYTTADDELVIVGKTGETFREKVGEITYMEWLGVSNSLVYFTSGNHLTGYLLHPNASKPVKIYTWYGTRREVARTYFSPYLEFLYIEMRNGTKTEVYKFDAVYGISQLPLGDLKIEHIDYDDKADIMTFTTPEGKVWRYENDRLYRPDGSEVRQEQPVHHHRPDIDDYPNTK